MNASVPGISETSSSAVRNRVAADMTKWYTSLQRISLQLTHPYVAKIWLVTDGSAFDWPDLGEDALIELIAAPVLTRVTNQRCKEPCALQMGSAPLQSPAQLPGRPASQLCAAA